MEFKDELFARLDWDPEYLCTIFEEDFNDIDGLWNFEICSDQDLLEMAQISNCLDDKYVPVVEDISLDDNVLLNAVDQIESE